MSDITIPLWVLPVIWTVLSCIPLFAYRPAGPYDLLPLRLIMASAISTLIGWLIYGLIV